MKKQNDPNPPTPDVPDELNPEFLFSDTHTALLVKMVAGKLDPMYLVKTTLASRGLDRNGKWIGFDEARKAHGLTTRS